MVDIYQIGKDILNYWMKRRVDKIPIKKYIKLVEKKLKIKLSKNSKEDLLYNLEQEGKIVTSRTGQKYVYTGNIHS